MTTRTKRIGKILAIVVAVIAALYLGLTVWSFVALHRAYAALARDGRPMTAAEVIPPPVPAAENAAPLYEEAFRLLKAEKLGDSTLLEKLSLAARDAAATNATPADVTRFRELVTRPAAQHALDLVVQAGERKSCRFDLDYASPLGVTCSNMVDLFAMCRIIRGEVSRRVNAGENSNAWHLAIAGLGLAQAQQAEPFLFSQLTTIYLEAIADASVCRLCTAAFPTHEQSDCALAALSRMDHPADFQRMLDGERLLLFEQEFAHTTREGVCQTLTMAEVPSWEQNIYQCAWRTLWRLDHAAYLHVLRIMASTPLSRNMPPLQIPRYCFCTRSLLPTLDDCRTNFTAHLARIRCTEAGLSALVYKKEHGAWPETLASCMAQVPGDPFADKPLRYRVTEKGFVVSSVGKIRNTKEIAWEYEPDNVR